MPSTLTAFVSPGSSTLHSRIGPHEWERDALEMAMAPIASATRELPFGKRELPPFSSVGPRPTVISSCSDASGHSQRYPPAWPGREDPVFLFLPSDVPSTIYILIALFEELLFRPASIPAGKKAWTRPWIHREKCFPRFRLSSPCSSWTLARPVTNSSPLSVMRTPHRPSGSSLLSSFPAPFCKLHIPSHLPKRKKR